MAATAPVLKDASKLSRLDRGLYRLEEIIAFIGGIFVLFLMLLAVVQILGRKLFNLPVPGYIDFVEQSMAVIAFLGIAYCQRVGGHIRMDLVVGRLKGRALWAAELMSVILMFFLSLALTYGSWSHFLRAYQIGDSSMDLGLPTWPAKLMVPLALSMLSLRLLLQIWGYWRAFSRDELKPVAVPLIETAEETAMREAESVSDAKEA